MPGERGIVAGALLALALLGWAALYLMPMPMPVGGSVAAADYVALSIAMWFVMMIAMMTPAVIPVVLLYDKVVYRGAAGFHARTAGFLGGYFSVWLGFSVLATLAQALLIASRWSDAMGVSRRPAFTAALLIAAGLYQWLPLKAACLEHCRSPLHFVMHQRRGTFGPWRMGVDHGVYCLGCCWLLMLLLFVGGVMNLAWVAALAVLVAIEKLGRRPDLVRRLTGLIAVAAAVCVLLAG
jgi:predicted metal-binding membrane protein